MKPVIIMLCMIPLLAVGADRLVVGGKGDNGILIIKGSDGKTIFKVNADKRVAEQRRKANGWVEGWVNACFSELGGLQISDCYRCAQNDSRIELDTFGRPWAVINFAPVAVDLNNRAVVTSWHYDANDAFLGTVITLGNLLTVNGAQASMAAAFNTTADDLVVTSDIPLGSVTSRLCFSTTLY